MNFRSDIAGQCMILLTVVVVVACIGLTIVLIVSSNVNIE